MFNIKSLLVLVLLLHLSCGVKDISNAQVVEYRYTAGMMKKTYYLNYDLSGDFDILFNGYAISRNRKEGVKMSYEYLNPYISKSGIQTISLSLKHLNSNLKINPETLKGISIAVYSSENGEQPPFEKIHVFKLPDYKVEQSSIFHTWTFEADVPFEITTLDDALDLANENPEELLKEVFLAYENVHELINQGKIEDYLLLYKKSREREMISMYYDEAQQKDYLAGLAKRASSSIGFMQPLTDIKLLIHPNNKIVSLVNSTGRSPLYAKDQQGIIKTYGLQLYRSIKTGKLEIY